MKSSGYDAFKKYIREKLNYNDYTCAMRNVILVDLREPFGKRVSWMPRPGVQSTDRCKAYVALTRSRKMVVVILDLFGNAHHAYTVLPENRTDVSVQKGFLGTRISCKVRTESKCVPIDMYAAELLFGTELKKQKEHLQMFETLLTEAYFRQLSESEIDPESIYTAPVHFEDVGIGGGERFLLHGSNGKQEVIGMNDRYKVRLIYPGRRAVTGWLSLDGIKDDESIVIVTEQDAYELKFDLNGCDIEVIQEDSV